MWVCGWIFCLNFSANIPGLSTSELNLLFHYYVFVCIPPGKAIPKMNYTVSDGTLNPTHSLTPASEFCSISSCFLKQILNCTLCTPNIKLYVFTRKSSYCFSASCFAHFSLRNSVRSSICSSVTRVDQSKTVQARITKSSRLAVWKTLVWGTVKLFQKFEGVTLNYCAKWVGGRKNWWFLANKSLYLDNGAR